MCDENKCAIYQTVTDEVRTDSVPEVQSRLIKACGGITLSISISKFFFETFSTIGGKLVGYPREVHSAVGCDHF